MQWQSESAITIWRRLTPNALPANASRFDLHRGGWRDRGVETLGGINDFVREAIRFYPNLRPEYLRFILVTPDEVILPELNRKLGIYAQRKLAARGVGIITNARVSAMAEGVVELTNGHKIPANTLIWTAGTMPNPLVAGLPLPQRNGRIAVDECLAVEDWPGLWAVGDCASVSNPRADFIRPLPSTPREGAVVGATSP